LPRKLKTLNLNLSTTKKRKKERKEGRKKGRKKGKEKKSKCFIPPAPWISEFPTL
jgi:hypothetical protein